MTETASLRVAHDAKFPSFFDDDDELTMEKLKSFNFPCNTLFYWLKNLGDFVSARNNQAPQNIAQKKS